MCSAVAGSSNATSTQGLWGGHHLAAPAPRCMHLTHIPKLTTANCEDPRAPLCAPLVSTLASACHLRTARRPRALLTAVPQPECSMPARRAALRDSACPCVPAARRTPLARSPCRLAVPWAAQTRRTLRHPPPRGGTACVSVGWHTSRWPLKVHWEAFERCLPMTKCRPPQALPSKRARRRHRCQLHASDNVWPALCGKQRYICVPAYKLHGRAPQHSLHRIEYRIDGAVGSECVGVVRAAGHSQAERI